MPPPKNGRREANQREERNARIDEMLSNAKRRLTKVNPLPVPANKVKGGIAKPPRKRP